MLIGYVPSGGLLGFLRKSRGLNDTYFKDPDIKPQTNSTSQQLIKFTWKIDDGMRYLSSKSVIVSYENTRAVGLILAHAMANFRSNSFHLRMRAS